MNTTVAPATTPAPSLAGRERTCAQCFTQFQARKAWAAFCGPTCRKRASRQTPPDALPCVTESPPPSPYANPHVTHERPISGAPEGPQWIESSHGDHRIYPRTYAEHGLPFPGYLRVKAR